MLIIFVSIKPGLTPFTKTPLGPTSLLKAFTKLFCAPLTDEYTTSLLAPISPQIDVIKIILPLWLLIIGCKKCCVIFHGALTWKIGRASCRESVVIYGV